MERKEITRNSYLGTYSNILKRIKSSNTKKQKGGICTLFQYYYYKPHSLTHKQEIKCVKIIMLPKKQKLVSSTKTNWCMAESSRNVGFFFLNWSYKEIQNSCNSCGGNQGQLITLKPTNSSSRWYKKLYKSRIWEKWALEHNMSLRSVKRTSVIRRVVKTPRKKVLSTTLPMTASKGNIVAIHLWHCWDKNVLRKGKRQNYCGKITQFLGMSLGPWAKGIGYGKVKKQEGNL